MEEEVRPIRKQQRRLNLTILDVVKKEVVPKKSRMVVMKNQHDELVPMQIQNSWRVCIDYRRLNQAAHKDHFPLPFIDRVLEKLAGKSHYYFLDGFSRYMEIHIASKDQHKTTFTCPFDTFAYTCILAYAMHRVHFNIAWQASSRTCYKIAWKGIEVDKSKIDIITSLPNLASMREVHSFLGHARFYRRSIKNFSKIVVPLSKLLQKDVDFKFDQPCVEAF
ncbi:hypothetical protein CR513_26096, partial [Mucuna pruriens]